MTIGKLLAWSGLLTVVGLLGYYGLQSGAIETNTGSVRVPLALIAAPFVFVGTLIWIALEVAEQRRRARHSDPAYIAQLNSKPAVRPSRGAVTKSQAGFKALTRCEASEKKALAAWLAAFDKVVANSGLDAEHPVYEEDLLAAFRAGSSHAAVIAEAERRALVSR